MSHLLHCHPTHPPQEMQAAGLKPNDVVCNSLVSVFRSAGQTDLAFSFVEGMPSMGVTPDVITYSNLIRACERWGQWQRAEATFDEMKQKRIAPDVMAYNNIMSAMITGGQIDRAIGYFHEMQVCQQSVHGVCRGVRRRCGECEEGV